MQPGQEVTTSKTRDRGKNTFPQRRRVGTFAAQAKHEEFRKQDIVSRGWDMGCIKASDGK